MDFNLVNHVEQCSIMLPQMINVSLLYYSHFLTGIVVLSIGFFVFIKNRNLLTSKILLSISLAFSLWLVSNLIAWVSSDSRMIMFFWSLLEILDPIFYALCLYFVYVYVDKKDISLLKKLILTILIFPVIVIALTNFGIENFYVTDCIATENNIFVDYISLVELIISLWILVAFFMRYYKASKEDRKQIILLIVGISFFLFSFFFVSYLAQYLFEIGILTGYGYEIYGLFGMVIFMGFLAYLIVQYKAFNIKLLATNALVAALVILIGSELFFAEGATNQILILVTLALSLGFGYMLIKSVQLEVQRKEQLQEMSDKLAAANDQLRKLDNAKSEFISIASHQLRTPLTAVKGFVSLLLEGSYGQVAVKQKDVLNKVYQSNERLIDLVEDLLNLSRIESGRMEYNFEKINIGEVCEEVYDTFVIKAKEHNLELELVKPEALLPQVATDRNKVREIISNMVDNAIKYTPQGGVKIYTTSRNGMVRVSIKDTGIGVPKEEVPYLFTKFSRGKNISRLSAGGIGLGLHVGMRMIEELHGKLGVESEGEGKGSIFYVELPVEMPE